MSEKSGIVWTDAKKMICRTYAYGRILPRPTPAPL